MEAKELKDLLGELKGQFEKAIDSKIEAKADQDAKAVKALEEQILTLKTQAEEAQKIIHALGQKNTKTETENKGFSDRILDLIQPKAADFKALANNRSASVSFDVNIKAAANMTTANYSGGLIGLTAWDGEISRPARRSPFMRQLVRNRPIGDQGISWAEVANRDGGAAMTAEGALKSKLDFDIVERREVARKITAYVKATKEALQDIPNLRELINTELVEAIELKLDEQILSGNNTGENLKGILEYAPDFAVTGTVLENGVDAANYFDVLRIAAWQVLNSGNSRYNPTVAIINPIDAAMMDVSKFESGGGYVMPPFSTNNGQTIFGLRVVANLGVAAGTFVVGDFSKSVLGIREEVNINVGYENDDFTKNLVTILAEMRAFHYIKTNDLAAFVQGTFATAAADLETA
jgi:HK97 family phage major capsid protein